MTLENQATESAKSRLDRIYAIVLAAVSVLALFLPYTVIMGKNDGNFTASAKLLFLSFGGNTRGVGLLSLLCVIFMLASAIASAAINILAIFNQNNAPTLIRVGSFVLSVGAGLYSMSVFALSMYQKDLKTAFDIVSLIISIIALAIFAILSFKKYGKVMSKPAAQYGVTLFSTVLLVLAVASSEQTVNALVIALVVLAWLSLVFSQVCVMYAFESALLHRIRLIAHLAIAFLLCMVSLFSLGGAAFIISFLAVIVAAIPVAENFLRSNNEETDEEETANEGYVYSEYSENGEEEYDENEPELEMFPSIPRPKMVSQDDTFAIEQPEEAPAPAPAPAVANDADPVATIELMEGYRVEEYAEAYPYEGGPVEGVELAEEVNPTFIPKGQVSTGGYDFYNCQSFDPFIASLNNEERNQFTEIFILKYKGVMPEIPDYVVGGDNREFFRKIFIYLGQYRDRIPNELLNKIYAFSIKIS